MREPWTHLILWRDWGIMLLGMSTSSACHSGLWGGRGWQVMGLPGGRQCVTTTTATTVTASVLLASLIHPSLIVMCQSWPLPQPSISTAFHLSSDASLNCSKATQQPARADKRCESRGSGANDRPWQLNRGAQWKWATTIYDHFIQYMCSSSLSHFFFMLSSFFTVSWNCVRLTLTLIAE